MHGEAHTPVGCLSRAGADRRALFAAMVAGLLAAAACSLRPARQVSQSFTSMGTIASISVPEEYGDELEPLTSRIKAEFRRLEELFTTYQPDSEISVLAREAGAKPVPVSADTLHVLVLSRRYGELTLGAFDVTVAPLVRLWGFGVHPPNNPPEAAEIASQLRLVDYRKIQITAGTASLPAGMSVDLGGIGKGYAVDRGFELLRGTRIKSAMLDFGGNIRVLGQARSGENWIIGVRDPFNRGQLLGRIALPDGMAVATSGNYERFVEFGGRRYAHIIDPRTGSPVEGMAGVTVVAPDATLSDALSTGMFVLGIEAGSKVIRGVAGAAAVFVPDRQPTELWLSPGMGRYFEPLPEYAAATHAVSPAPAR